MIFGDYPCCNGPLTLSIPEGVETPVIQREICPHCGALVWHKLSIIDPESWTDAGFREVYDVDDVTKGVKLKGGDAPPLPPAVQAIVDYCLNQAMDETVRQMENQLLYGTARR